VQPIGELFPGEPTDELPDLIVHWNRRTPIRRVRSPHYGSIARDFPGVRTGDHRPEGLLVARGPGILANPGGAPVRSVDVPATIAHMLGVSLPELDGRPIAALVQTPRAASPTGPAS
jgi:hypothetical protein